MLIKLNLEKVQHVRHIMSDMSNVIIIIYVYTESI